MITIEYYFDYGCYPVWITDGEGGVIDTSLPTEISDDIELDQLMTQLQQSYEKLFCTNPFRYIGFRTTTEKREFECKVNEAYELLCHSLQGRYKITNKMRLH